MTANLNHVNIITDKYNWNDALVEACGKFVKFKDDLDKANRTSYLHPLFIRKIRRLAGYYEPSMNKKAGAMSKRSATAINPYEFCCETLPFLCTRNTHVSQYNKRLIYPQLVVSGTYRKYNTQLGGGYINNIPDDVMDSSDNRILNQQAVSDELKYYRHEALPLYVATEGKNRVELFKLHRSSMMAWVMVLPSIPATELKLVRLRPFNIWAVRHNDQLRTLPFSNFTLAIYRSLGIAEDKAEWDFFALKKLRDARLSATSSQMLA